MQDKTNAPAALPELSGLLYLAAEIGQVLCAQVNQGDSESLRSLGTFGSPPFAVERVHLYCQRVLDTKSSLELLEPDSLYLPPNPGEIGYYLGLPLMNAKGQCLGTLSLMSRKAIKIDKRRRHLLTILAQQITGVLEKQALSDQLLAAERLLAEARAEKDAWSKNQRDYLGHLSHELRTPLHGMQGLLSLIREKIPGQTETHWDDFQSSLHSLSETLSTLMDHANFQSGGLLIQSSLFSVQELVEQAVAPFRASAVRKGLTFELNAEIPEGLNCVSDPVRVRQIIGNLMSNAIKFTDCGTVSLTLQPLETSEGENYIALSVQDTGPGLSDSVRQRLFEPYHINPEGQKRGGSGLGLSIVRSIVDALSGHIDVESTPGQGSTFTVLLPLILSAQSTAPVHEKLPQGAVLLVEDNNLSETLTKLYLSQLGLDCVVAGSFEEAKSALDHQEFCAVLLDLHLEDAGPQELVEGLRSRTVAPLLAVSGDSLSATELRTLGLDASLTKPYDKQQLHQLLEQWIASEGEIERWSRDWHPGLEALHVQCGPEFLQRLLGNFVKLHPQDMKEIETACRDKTWDVVGLGAHSMKSTLATLGLHSLASQAARLERLAPTGDTTEIHAGIQQLKREARRLYPVLLRYSLDSFPLVEVAS